MRGQSVVPTPALHALALYIHQSSPQLRPRPWTVTAAQFAAPHDVIFISTMAVCAKLHLDCGQVVQRVVDSLWAFDFAL